MPAPTTQREDTAEPLMPYPRRSKWHAVRLRALRSGEWTRATPVAVAHHAALLLKARVRTGHGQWRPRGAWDADVVPANDAQTRFHVRIRPTAPDQRTT